jgi:hypothetical protein
MLGIIFQRLLKSLNRFFYFASNFIHQSNLIAQTGVVGLLLQGLQTLCHRFFYSTAGDQSVHQTNLGRLIDVEIIQACWQSGRVFQRSLRIIRRRTN